MGGLDTALRHASSINLVSSMDSIDVHACDVAGVLMVCMHVQHKQPGPSQITKTFYQSECRSCLRTLLHVIPAVIARNLIPMSMTNSCYHDMMSAGGYGCKVVMHP